jgi:hypothetical protein
MNVALGFTKNSHPITRAKAICPFSPKQCAAELGRDFNLKKLPDTHKYAGDQ